MKKTTYILIAILGLLLVIETLFIFVLTKTGKEKSGAEYESPYKNVDKLEIKVTYPDTPQWLYYSYDSVDSELLSTDSIYVPDTLIIIGSDIRIKFYDD